MKRNIIIIVVMTMLSFSAAAQDTLHHNGPKDNYFCPPYRWFAKDTTCWLQYALDYTQTDLAFGYNSSDSITVYGIAAVLVPEFFDMSAERRAQMAATLCDTTLEKVQTCLRLFTYPAPYNNDSLEMYPEELPVHIKYTPISYYLDLGILGFGGMGDYFNPVNIPPLPVYERYFVNPVTIVDSFFVGLTNNTNHPAPSDTCRPTWEVQGVVFLRNGWDPYRITTAYREVSGGWVFLPNIQGTRFIFAILTPPDSNYVWDTTVVHGDTTMVGDTIIVCDTLVIGNDTIIQYDTILGIQENSLLQRLTGVMPNPAAETAKVVSSFGMTLVEVYNLAGEKVHTLRLPDAPLTATLDVGRWPSGAYILRIHTPQGIAVKKLAVRH